MSAKIAAATEDLWYEKRYHKYEPSLDHAIKVLKQAYIDKDTRRFITEASKNKLEFKLKLDDALPRINFDKDRIVEVLINLVNNAIKYTKKGGVTIAYGKGSIFNFVLPISERRE